MVRSIVVAEAIDLISRVAKTDDHGRCHPGGGAPVENRRRRQLIGRQRHTLPTAVSAGDCCGRLRWVAFCSRSPELRAL